MGCGYNTQFLLYPRPLTWQKEFLLFYTRRYKTKVFILHLYLHFFYKIYFTVETVKKLQLSYCAKFRRNRSNHGRDMAIFQDGGLRHLGFLKWMGRRPPTTIGVRKLESLGYQVALFARSYV